MLEWFKKRDWPAVQGDLLAPDRNLDLLRRIYRERLGDEMNHTSVAYWWAEMGGWIESRSYADCHKFFNEHDDELVCEVLK